MRNKRFTVSLLAFFSLAIVGCQSTSQLAWWKSAKNSEIEATAIAHSAAPQLPSEAAKQAEKIAATGAAGSETIPAVPGTASTASMAAAMTPAAYPTTSYTGPTTPATSHANPATGGTGTPTGYTGYQASSVASLPDSYPTTQVPATPPPVSQVGTMAMPYDPGAVPPRSTSGAPAVAATKSATQADRYAVSTNTSNNPQTIVRAPDASDYQSKTPAYQTTGSQYGNSAASQRYVTTNQPGHVNPASSSAPPTGLLPAANGVAGIPATTGRTSSGMGIPSGDLVNPNPGTHSTLGTNMVANGSYRPGGTGNYPGTAISPSPVQVASRPDGTASAGLPVDNAIQSQPPQTQSVTEPASIRYR